MRKKGIDSKKDMIDAAIQLFKEKGFENVKITDICEKAGCTPSTFYYHFGSMDGFKQSLSDVEIQFSADRLIEIMSLTGAWNKLWAVHSTYVNEALDYGYSLYFHMHTPANSEERKATLENMKKINKIITPFVKEGQQSGEIRNKTALDDLVNTVGQTMYGVIREWNLHEGDFDLEKEMKRSLEVLYDLRPDLRTATKVQE